MRLVYKHPLWLLLPIGGGDGAAPVYIDGPAMPPAGYEQPWDRVHQWRSRALVTLSGTARATGLDVHRRRSRGWLDPVIGGSAAQETHGGVDRSDGRLARPSALARIVAATKRSSEGIAPVVMGQTRVETFLLAGPAQAELAAARLDAQNARVLGLVG